MGNDAGSHHSSIANLLGFSAVFRAADRGIMLTGRQHNPLFWSIMRQAVRLITSWALVVNKAYFIATDFYEKKS